MVRGKPKTPKRKKCIKRGILMQVVAWVGIIVCFTCVIAAGSTFAWYFRSDREADSKQPTVMEPYYLTLMNPSESDGLQLSIGSLALGKTKQIVFCVSNKNDSTVPPVNEGTSAFDYTIELIHTNNLALNYKIYELEKVTAESADIIAEDTKITEDGVSEQILTFWKVIAPDTPLNGVDMSTTRHTEAGVSEDEINRGTYMVYATGSDDVNLHMEASEDGYDSQYFLMEIEWDESAQTGFEKYEKETDMIYLAVKAVQPEPERKDETQ